MSTTLPNDQRLAPHVPISIISNNSNSNTAGDNSTIVNNNYVEVRFNARDQFAEDMAAIKDGLGKHHVPAAVYDAQPVNAGCMEGTRVQVLDEAKGLIIAREGPHVVWISGMAGTGKTSIAVTLCRRLRDDATVVLGGTFFCSRVANNPARAAVENIIPTLVSLLVCVAPGCAQPLATELKEDPDLAHKSIHVQIERLLNKPLEVLGTFGRPIVFVIDALDECTDKKQLVELLEAIAKFRSTVPVKFLITARPEPRIRKVRMSNPKLCSRIELYALDPKQVAADIRLFLEQSFKASSEPAWYTEDDIDELTKLADGLFVFAGVAAEYILEANSSDRLHTVKTEISISAIVTKRLDQMYSLVVSPALDPNAFEEKERDRMRKIISVILSSREPLSIKTLAELLELSPKQLREALDGLHSVFFVPEKDEEGELRFLHTTFADFFARAEPPIRISKGDCHDALAQICLDRLVKEDLRFNVSHVQSSYDGNPETKPMKHDRIPHSLRYACMHWAYHFCDASEPSGRDASINSFLKHKFLFWLEVLSIFGEVGLALDLLCVATKASKSQDLSGFLRDAILFVESSREAIEFSPAHIYISAFPFTPKDSLVAQTFKDLVSCTSIETFGTNPGCDDTVAAVAVSPDGRFLAFALTNGTIRAWDTTKQKEVGAATLSCEKGVRAIAISANGKHIATGVGHAIKVGQTRKADSWWQPPGEQHPSVVQTVAFSPDAAWVVSGSADGTVRLWSARSDTPWYQTAYTWVEGQVVQILALRWSLPFNSPVSSVAYSLTTQRIVAGYTCGTVQILHATTGGPWGDPFKLSKPLAGIGSLVFAPGGGFILAARDNEIHRISCVDGSEVSHLTGHTARVNSIAYSSDEQFIASGADDGTVRLWNAHDKNPCGHVLHGHSGAVLAVAFLPGGHSVVSAGSDGTVRVWVGVTPQDDQNVPGPPPGTSCIQDGWILGPTNQRLLWVPPKYRDRNELAGGRSKIIAANWHHAVLPDNTGDAYYGTRWTECWKGDSELLP